MTKKKSELPTYGADAFAAPASQYDIIMKGGITSSVVYPYAVLKIARQYRYRSIGGNSAGEIAAVFAAAAEYSVQSATIPAASCACRCYQRNEDRPFRTTSEPVRALI